MATVLFVAKVSDDGFARQVFAGSGYVIGEFRCPSWAHWWRTENWIGTQVHVVIPGTAVCIVADGADPHVCTANEVLVYDSDVRYRRRLVSDEGDRCLFFEVSDELAARLGLTVDDARVGRPGLRYAPLHASAYAQHRLLQAALAGQSAVDELSVDEWGLLLLAQTAAQMSACAPRFARTPTGRSATAQRHAVEAVMSMLATRMTGPLTLADLAAVVHYSPYFLARVFRRHTGYSIGRFRAHLRLRRSLERVLEPAADLSQVAVAHGFSSHSHYSKAFHEVFGCSPSAVRRAAGARNVRQLRGLAQVLTT